ncbi:bifunctional diguanylate cyclase/phosphodiesterase [Acinetobacter sp. NIPH 2699]|uniref:sensor domain-containing protein n=1 Tax=Acinetobacter sp. NIPH 2699 TaxID=2923433 RepID=UPI001F4B9185|nr:bifunctional diguanylate cyclase/phosphodiesterase [Acinetobacter sp. NIPH 2699]MCH7337023.1 EAL domain-containing protein [Acinetobacter sp. NIPH 2699]
MNAVQQNIFNSIPSLVWLISDMGDAYFFNSVSQEYIGLTELEKFEKNWMDLIHFEDISVFQNEWQQAFSYKTPFQIECRLRHRSGAYRWFLLSAKFVDGNAGDHGYWFMNSVDIHETKQYQQNLMQCINAQTIMLDNSMDCIKLLDINGSLLHVNKTGCIALNIPESNHRFGMKWAELLAPEVRSKANYALKMAIKGKTARFRGMSGHGATRQYWDNLLTPILNDTGQIVQILCMSRDVTAQRQTEIQLRISSELDELTGLYNRRFFKLQLKRSLQRHKKSEKFLGLMLLDLDYFKHVNDTLGHAAGDHLLRILSKRIENVLPENTFVARLGGDEFAILVNGIDAEFDLEKIAIEVSRQLDAPITYAGNLINGSMSIGCAIYPRDAKDSSNLMKCADTALNDLKATGRGGFRMFNQQMQVTAQNIAIQLNQARHIIRDDLIVPFYQPKVRLADGKVIGFEALLRWQTDDNRIHSPCNIEQAFQDYMLATRISDAIQTKVFKNIAMWIEQGLDVVPVSINVAPVEFLKDNYAERLLQRLSLYKIPHHLVEIEITEHILDDRGSDYVIRALNLLKQRGVKIALDDFGTGHSSLTRLRDYPVDCLKIDCDFIRQMNSDEAILAIVQAIIALGPKLSLDIVAEGIENSEQLDLLKQSGCSIGQGYLFSRAVNAQQATHMLKRGMRLY